MKPLTKNPMYLTNCVECDSVSRNREPCCPDCGNDDPETFWADEILLEIRHGKPKQKSAGRVKKKAGK